MKTAQAISDQEALTRAVDIIKMYRACGTPGEKMSMREVSKRADYFLENEYPVS